MEHDGGQKYFKGGMATSGSQWLLDEGEIREVVVVCGPSGSGKSTLIKAVNALESIQMREIYVDGVAVQSKATGLPRLRSRSEIPAPFYLLAFDDDRGCRRF